MIKWFGNYNWCKLGICIPEFTMKIVTCNFTPCFGFYKSSIQKLKVPFVNSKWIYKCISISINTTSSQDLFVIKIFQTTIKHFKKSSSHFTFQHCMVMHVCKFLFTFNHFLFPQNSWKVILLDQCTSLKLCWCLMMSMPTSIIDISYEPPKLLPFSFQSNQVIEIWVYGAKSWFFLEILHAHNFI